MTDWTQLDLFGGSTAQAAAPAPVQCPTCKGSGAIDADTYRRLAETPGRTQATGTTTSRSAGSTPAKGTQRALVLLAVDRIGPANAYEVWEWLHTQPGTPARLSPDKVGTRLQELRDDLFVQYHRDPDTGEIVEHEATSGNTGLCMSITPAGRMVAARVVAQATP